MPGISPGKRPRGPDLSSRAQSNEFLLSAAIRTSFFTIRDVRPVPTISSRTAANWRFGIRCRSPWVDDRDAGGLKWRLVSRSHAELPGSSNRRDLGIGNCDRMTMPASACNDLWIGFGTTNVERHDALAE